MPLPGYGVLVGSLRQWVREVADPTPHFQILLDGGVDGLFRVPVNVRSRIKPPDLMFHHIADFRHPLTDWLAGLDAGWHPRGDAQGHGLDYLRDRLIDPVKLRRLPHNVPGPDNDLSDVMEGMMAHVLDDEGARIHAFGARWGPEPRADIVFGFTPTQGVHDVHMNQGNPRHHADDNGIWQDGGLILHLPGENRWVAILFAFQSQHVATDDETGHPIPQSLRLSDHALGHARAGRSIGPLRMIALADDRRHMRLANLGRYPISISGAYLFTETGRKQPLPNLRLPAKSELDLPLNARLPRNLAGRLALYDSQDSLHDAVNLSDALQRSDEWLWF